jgi:hypothetical protein
MNPRTSECLTINSISNPTVPAILSNFRSWKNRGDGANFDEVGDVRLTNFFAADNLWGGAEFSRTDLTADGTA